MTVQSALWILGVAIFLLYLGQGFNAIQIAKLAAIVAGYEKRIESLEDWHTDLSKRF